MLKVVYIIFLGILLLAFVEFGATTLYREPQVPPSPAEPVCAVSGGKEILQSNDCTLQIQRQEKQYEQDQVVYGRTIVIVMLVAALIFLVAGLLLEKKVGVIADGLVLGGVLILVDSIARSFTGQDSVYRFITVSASLAIVLILGYIKFIKPQQVATTSKGK